MSKRLRNVDEIRKVLLQQQLGICPIYQIPISGKDACVDHNHHDPWEVRGVLHRQSNAMLGKLERSYFRYIKPFTHLTLKEVLANMVEYLERKTIGNPIHPSALNEWVKPFKRLNADNKKMILKNFGLNPGKNDRERVKSIRTLLQKDIITYGELLEEVRALEKFV